MLNRIVLQRVLVITLAAALLAGCRDAGAPSPEGDGKQAVDAPVGGAQVGAEEVAEPILPVRIALQGDLDEILARRKLRILVPYNRTNYYIERGIQKGATAEMGLALEAKLNEGRKKTPTEQVHVVFVPTPRDRIFPDLQAGYGDIAAGSLTITGARLELMDFTTPVISGVREVVVAGPGAPPLATLDDLGGKEVYVRKSSSYWEHLETINASRRSDGKPEMVLVPANENLEDDDILEMVDAGVVQLTVVDDFTADLWAQVLPGLTVKKDIAVNEGGEIAWAVRKQSPQLLAYLNPFIEDHKKGTTFGNVMYRKYVGSGDRLRNPTAEAERAKFRAMMSVFQKHGTTYGIDYLLLLAQGYQESQLDQARRSKAGAVGIMQLLPSTAAGPPIGIRGVDKDPEKNIEAGAKYLRYVMDRYLSDPAITPENRTLLAFAAYNAGPGNLAKFRALAEKSGLDPNVWFGNVELGAARIVGSETVRYVANIYKYYVAYTLSVQATQAREQAREPGTKGD